MKFYKFHGAGNDFVLIDDRKNQFDHDNQPLIERMCHRRFGIGADGLMLLRNHDDFDFEMVYFNSDGRTSSMCGNGGRCIVAFAQMLGVIQHQARFIAIDGEHDASILPDGQVRLGMINVDRVERRSDNYFLDTGSPHYVAFVENADDIDLIPQAHAIRYNDEFKHDGTNVNYGSLRDGILRLRTYERGVEDETWACGTGATAAAIAAFSKGLVTEPQVRLAVNGGDLMVDFKPNGEGFDEVYLTGPAEFVYEGRWKDEE